MEIRYKKEIKQKIKAGIPENDLTTIAISTENMENGHNGFVWVKPNKEFRLNGQMYDIVRQDTDGNMYFFRCILDTQETLLFANLDNLIHGKMQEADSFPAPLIAISLLIIRQAECYELIKIQNNSLYSEICYPPPISSCQRGYSCEQYHPPEF